jgi:hypothetical protein
MYITVEIEAGRVVFGFRDTDGTIALRALPPAEALSLSVRILEHVCALTAPPVVGKYEDQSGEAHTEIEK